MTANLREEIIVSAADPKPESLQPFVDLMRAQGLSDPAIASFAMHLRRLRGGDRGTIAEDEIHPVPDLSNADDLEAHREIGTARLDTVVVIKLNGGLGTSMGLDRAKSLLPVRGRLSFLDLIARQVLALRERVGAKIPLLLMNSFRTAADSERALADYPDLVSEDLGLGFLQNRVPKILSDGMVPAVFPDDPELEWCPPGHGDFFTAIAASGLLDRVLEAGIEYAFVSNADNLGAVLDPAILGFMVAERADFLLEAADRTAADRKGGHLCRLKNGRLALRESAQCPPEAESAFQDVNHHRYFNTNNVWLHLPTLAELLAEHHGFLPLPTIVNHKTLDPRDPTSPPVFQLETAMGNAISLFPRAAAIRVPRHRFSPVKNTNDLLAVRSDAYELTDDSRVILHPDRATPPVVRLDERFFKLIDEFDRRFPAGPPSLRHCSSLVVEGDISFAAGVVVEGDAVIRTEESGAALAEGSVVRGEVFF
jgi:UTP--glucose-1-phosphate uridylyltransferase